MNMKEMLGALPKKEKRQPLTVLDTIWGEKLDTSHVLEDYPPAPDGPLTVRNA